MDMKPIIVMAGTPVDTQMGMDCLSTQGLPGVFCPISEDPNQQTAFQISSTEEKIDTVVSLLCAAQREHGCEKAFIYCNSLSGALDFQFVARETGLKIVTPLDVYRLLAPKYHSLAVIAANAQGTAGIERTLLSANPDLTLRSTGLLPVVLGIEAGEDPDTLVKQNRLPELVNWYQALGAEALVLGCTHYVFLRPVLRRMLPPETALLDGNAGTVRQLHRVLEQRGLCREAPSPGRVELLTSGDPLHILPQMERLLHLPDMDETAR